jgi:hypothetical protein
VSLVYDGIGQLLVEWAIPLDETNLRALDTGVSFFVGSTIGLLGSYAISHGLWRIARGEQPGALDLIAAPWREAAWAIPMAFSLALLLVVGLLLGVVPALVAQVLLIVAAPVAAVERTGGIETLKRAFALGAGQRGRATGVFAIVSLGLVAASAPASLVEPGGAAPALVLTALLHAGVACLGDVVTFMLYADLRVRKESFDLELLAEAVASGSEPGPPDDENG